MMSLGSYVVSVPVNIVYDIILDVYYKGRYKFHIPFLEVDQHLGCVCFGARKKVPGNLRQEIVIPLFGMWERKKMPWNK